MSREYTNKLVAMIDDGILDANAVVIACVKYMSEADVQDMMESEGWADEDEEDEFVSVVWVSPDGVKLHSVPATDVCKGCHYDTYHWLYNCNGVNKPSCAGIIWVESTES